jgi:hypothetical protein
MSYNGNNISQNFSIININDNKNFKNNDSNLPKIQEDENKKSFTLLENRNVVKEGNLIKFIHSKNKIKQRLELMSKEKMNITNQSLGKRIIIKDLKNTIIADSLSKTTKGFY